MPVVLARLEVDAIAGPDDLNRSPRAVMAWRFVTTGGIEMLRAHSRRPEASAKLVQDPVCGMSVDPATAKDKIKYAGATYYFCSAGCRATFEKDPARYAALPVQVARPTQRM